MCHNFHLTKINSILALVLNVRLQTFEKELN